MASVPATDHVLVTALPETQMLPPPTRQAFEPQRYTKQEWEAQKCMIEGPWKDFKIKDVVTLLKERGFYITEKQLKGRIKTWGLGKNVRGREMKAIVRKQAESVAEGKKLRYRVRGNPVEESKIIRWQKANRPYGQVLEQDSVATSPQAATPSDISCSTVTPIGSPASNLTSFGLVQNFNHMDSIAIPSTRSPKGTTYQSHRTMAAPQSSTAKYAPGIWHLLQHDDESFDGRSPAPYPAPGTPLPENNRAANTISVATNHDEQSFEGRSPVPFFAPASPVPEKSRAENIMFVAANRPVMYDGEEAQYSKFQRLGSSFDVSQNDSFSQHIEQQELVPSDVSRNLPQRDEHLQSKKYVRYRQKDEEELIERLNIFEARYGTTHPTTLDTAERLLDVYMCQSRHRTAESLCRKIIGGWHETVGDSNWRTLLAFGRLSTIYRLQGKLRKAESLSRWTYTMSLSTLGPNHPNLLSIRNGLASCYMCLSRDQEAEPLLRENIRVGTLTLPPDSFVLLDSMFYLADLLKDQGQSVESGKIAREILLSNEMSSKPDQYFLLKARGLLGKVLREQNYADAEIFLRNLLQDSARILGPEHTLTLRHQNTLAIHLIGSDSHEESVQLLKDCVQKSTEIRGRQNPDTISFELNLANALVHQKEYSEAEAISERASRVATTEFGPNHELTNLSALRLGQCYHGRGDLEKASTILSSTLAALQQSAHPESWMIKRCSSLLEEVKADLLKNKFHGAEMFRA